MKKDHRLHPGGLVLSHPFLLSIPSLHLSDKSSSLRVDNPPALVNSFLILNHVSYTHMTLPTTRRV